MTTPSKFRLAAAFAAGFSTGLIGPDAVAQVPEALRNAPALVVSYGDLQGEYAFTTFDVEKGKAAAYNACRNGGAINCRVHFNPGGKPACIGMNVWRSNTPAPAFGNGHRQRSFGATMVIDEATREKTHERLQSLCTSGLNQCGPRHIVVCNDGGGAVMTPFYSR